MITDSILKQSSWLGRLVRLPLRLIPASREVRILRGPARGLRWIAGSSSHGCWLGTYEPKVLQAFADLIRPGMVVHDVGANVGLFTLVAAGRGAFVHAFEPLPRNARLLREHVSRNDFEERVTVVEAAVGRVSGTARFRTESTGLEGAMDPRGEREVGVVALDDRQPPDPQVIKIDVEGGELDVLAGAAHLIHRARPTIFLELHPGGAEASCRSLLERAGYELRPLGDDRRFLAEPVSDPKRASVRS